MKPNERWVLAAVIVLVDVMVFALPLTALFAAYVLVARPSWFYDWVKRLYEA